MTTRQHAYAFHVEGHLDRPSVAWLGAHEVTHHDDGTSTLVVGVVDQAELHGVLTRVRDLGVSLLAVSQLPDPCRVPDAAAAATASPTARQRATSRSMPARSHGV